MQISDAQRLISRVFMRPWGTQLSPGGSVYIRNSNFKKLYFVFKKKQQKNFYFVIVSLTRGCFNCYYTFFISHFTSLTLFSFAVNPCCYYPCQHSGVCVRYGMSQYKCDCTNTGYSGVNCTVRKYINCRVINVSSGSGFHIRLMFFVSTQYDLKCRAPSE